MGIWRSIFGWRGLFRWDVFGVVVTGLLLASGLGMLGIEWFPHNLSIAQICFVTACIFCLVKFVGHAIESQGSKASRLIFALVVSIALCLLTALIVGGIQQHKNPSLTRNPAILAACSFLTYMRRPWPQRILWIAAGMILTLLIELLIFAVAGVAAAQRRRNASTEKGFLDHKLLVEEAMNKLPSIIEQISKTVVQVGRETEIHSSQVRGAANASARAQREVVGGTARMLVRYSRQLDSKCVPLERVADSLAEGQLAWFSWMKAHGTLIVESSPIRRMMSGMCDTMSGVLNSSVSYLETIESLRGVSQELNAAVDVYAASLRRIQNANLKIMNSCLSTLKLTQEQDG